MKREKVLCECNKNVLLFGPVSSDTCDLISRRIHGLSYHVIKHVNEEDTFYICVDGCDAFSALKLITRVMDIYLI